MSCDMKNDNKKIKAKYKRGQKTSKTSVEELNKMSNEELVEKVIQLEAHNLQLQNILHNKCQDESKKERSDKKYNFESVSKRHVFLKILYFGWDCQGYVTQEDTCNTIEYYLFNALEKCCLIDTREKSNYHRCGRTDKGVSAFSQVISIDLRSKLKEPSPDNCQDELPYCTMLNRLLPDHIRCYAWTHLSDNYSARFDCSSRIYNYYFPRGNLDINKMKQSAKYFIGNHDFRNFCKMDIGNGVTKFNRTIMLMDIRCCENPGGSEYDMFKLVIEGNGFLWHQVRYIMAVLFLIGQGKEQPEVIQQLLDVTKNPNKPQYSMANHVPLNLFHCNYESINVKWNIDDKELANIVKQLQNQWTFHSVKRTMTKEIIDELLSLKQDSSDIKSQVEHLVSGVQPRVYKPLLSRMKCESLESRIQHYIKRRKLVKE